MRKKFFILLMGLVVVLAVLGSKVNTSSGVNNIDASVLGSAIKAVEGLKVPTPDISPEVAARKSSLKKVEISETDCEYDLPETPEYSASLVAIRKKFRVKTDEEFRIKVFIENTGNTPWFSFGGECKGPIINLGTDNKRDHASQFYSPNIEKSDNNWVSANRIKLDQPRVNPGEVASFTFWVKASSTPDIYKEFLTPVVEDTTWLDDAGFSFDTVIGDLGESPSEVLRRRLLMGERGSAMELDLEAEKRIKVSLAEQKMYLHLGDHLIREFPVSTGAPRTPTPVGEFSISLKQEVRVGGKAPHYVMPNFMMFRKDGYGIHALPSLSRKGGDVFWTEARDHIGIPVSHGCIRMLPEDSDFAFDFADIGTTLEVYR